MLDLSFVLGLALGTIVTGFCAIGSFDRGLDSVRRRSWTAEHAARKRAVIASRTALRAAARPAAKGATSRAS